MTGRMFQFLIGVVIFICSTPSGMAQKTIREDVRADFFVAADDEEIQEADFSQDDERNVGEAVPFIDEEAALFEAESVEFSETQTECEKQSKRVQKRLSGKNHFISKCRILTGLSTELLTKGASSHPLTQDAQQERRAVIRFLQQQALIF